MRQEWIVGSNYYRSVHSSSCGRGKCPTYWRDSRVQHCPLNHVILWKALSTWSTVSKPVITYKLLCEFWDEDHSEILLLLCYCLVPSAAVGVNESCCRHAFVQTGQRTYIYMFCPFQRQDPDLHKAAFSYSSGRTAYFSSTSRRNSMYLASGTKNKACWLSLISFKSVYSRIQHSSLLATSNISVFPFDLLLNTCQWVYYSSAEESPLAARAKSSKLAWFV